MLLNNLIQRYILYENQKTFYIITLQGSRIFESNNK